MEYVKYDKVIAELKQFMSNAPKVDYITFSGYGEPTLNSRIGEILSHIKQHYPDVKTAVLTSGALLYDKEMRGELLESDLILPSLDAASQTVFEKINRPNPKLKIEKYIQGLIDFRKEYKGGIWLEVFLLKGYNDSSEELALLKEAILKIEPDVVQLNTLDRPGTVKNLTPLSNEELQNIIDLWGIENVEIIAPATERSDIESFDTNIEATILSTIARRPCTLDDLHQILGIHVNEINKYLGVLEVNNKIKSTTLDRGLFYELDDK